MTSHRLTLIALASFIASRGDEMKSIINFVTAALIVAAVATHAATVGQGPFVAPDTGRLYVPGFLYLYLAVVSVTALLAAAAAGRPAPGAGGRHGVDGHVLPADAADGHGAGPRGPRLGRGRHRARVVPHVALPVHLGERPVRLRDAFFRGAPCDRCRACGSHRCTPACRRPPAPGRHIPGPVPRPCSGHGVESGVFSHEDRLPDRSASKPSPSATFVPASKVLRAAG